MNKTTSEGLLQQISSFEHLHKAWTFLNKSNKKSRGINSETIEEFERSVDRNLAEISRQLLKGTYKFAKVRAVLISKKEKDKYRPLRIQDVRDRVVCKALAIRLNEILSPIYGLENDYSFAYRKETGVRDAISTIVKHYNAGYNIILEADIEKFFDTVDRNIMLNLVFDHLPDKSINHLIEAGLSQEIGNLHEVTEHSHYFEDSMNGIPQGNALSPLLANIYLSGFDKQIADRPYKLVRYADDFVIMCKTRKDALEAFEFSKDYLENTLKLRIHPLGKSSDSLAKTKIVDPQYDRFSFLSIRYNGEQLWVDDTKINHFKDKVKHVTDTSKFDDLITVLTKTRNLLEGWLSSFKFVDVDRSFREIDEYIDIQLYHVFRNFDFEIKTKALREIKIGKRKRITALTTTQRKRTGVKMCSAFLSSIDRELIIPKK